MLPSYCESVWTVHRVFLKKVHDAHASAVSRELDTGDIDTARAGARDLPKLAGG